jgi:hypothetical protein
MAKRQPAESLDYKALLGKPVDGFTLADQWRYAGVWVALELYTPQTLPVRLIAAAGASASECIAALRAKGMDPERFEYRPLAQPYVM